MVIVLAFITRLFWTWEMGNEVNDHSSYPLPPRHCLVYLSHRCAHQTITGSPKLFFDFPDCLFRETTSDSSLVTHSSGKIVYRFPPLNVLHERYESCTRGKGIVGPISKMSRVFACKQARARELVWCVITNGEG